MLKGGRNPERELLSVVLCFLFDQMVVKSVKRGKQFPVPQAVSSLAHGIGKPNLSSRATTAPIVHTYLGILNKWPLFNIHY